MALGDVYGRGQPTPDACELGSLAQKICLGRTREIYGTISAPSSTAAAALAELCGTRSGHLDEPQARTSYQRDLGFLPDPGLDTADGATVLQGKDLEAWQDWRNTLLREPEDALAEQEKLGLRSLCTDLALKCNPEAYAQFVLDLLERRLVQVRPRLAATVGVFFVRSRTTAADPGHKDRRRGTRRCPRPRHGAA